MAALTDYIGLLPSASSAQPKFVAFASALLQPFVDVQNTVLGFPNAFDIDNAVGVQLDGVGVRVGLSRKLAVPITGVYFALDGNVGPLITGNGATASAQLPTDLDLTKVSIYRDDWRGHTLLATTPRTNLALFSEQFDNAVWVRSNCTITPNAALAPDGNLTADAVVRTAVGNHYLLQTLTGTIAAGKSFTFFLQMKSGTYAGQVRVWLKDGAGVSLAINSVQLTPTWQEFVVSGTYPAGATGAPALYLDPNDDVGIAGDTFYVWGADVKAGLQKSAYIPTAGAAVTVTDCTISGTGLVTVNPTPPVGTNITWLDTRPGVGLDEGVIRGPFDPVDALTSLDDETYRLMLRIKILANNWDGSLEDAQQMLAALQTAGTYLFMQDLFDMSLILGVSGKVPSKLFVSILRQMNDWLRPGAVNSAIRVTSLSGSPIFGLDVQNSYIGGLDVGTVAIPY